MAQRMAKASERIAELLEDDTLTEDMVFTYTWDHGYERLTRHRDGMGSYEYAGSFHPNVTCEGEGICKWCGRTL
jgi:hypothetical protein